MFKSRAHLQASEVRRSNKSPALVDTWLLDAKDNIVFERAAVSDLEDTVTLRGGQGPWRLCFQQRTDHGGWRPSAEIQLDAFDVHLASFRGSRLQTDLSNNGNVRPLQLLKHPALLLHVPPATNLPNDKLLASADLLVLNPNVHPHGCNGCPPQGIWQFGHRALLTQGRHHAAHHILALHDGQGRKPANLPSRRRAV